MLFYLYLISSLIVLIFLTIFIITFGLPLFHGAQFAVTTPNKTKQIIQILKKYKTNVRVAELGSDDARIVISATKNRYKITGYEINPI